MVKLKAKDFLPFPELRIKIEYRFIDLILQRKSHPSNDRWLSLINSKLN